MPENHRKGMQCTPDISGMSTASDMLPLCVDCEGTLLRSNLLLEGVLQLVKGSLLNVFRLVAWSIEGVAQLKERVATVSELDVAHLPYNMELIERLREQQRAGRNIVLVTSAHQILARRIADHLGIFSAVFATSDGVNLDAAAKRKVLCQHFGDHGFVYVGSRPADVVIWGSAAGAWVIECSRGVERAVERICKVEWCQRNSRAIIADGVRALRPHQWLKNLLVLIPMFAAHRIGDVRVLVSSAVGAGCFCLCASSAYVLNDLLDLSADRRHPRKSARPFASGRISIGAGGALSLLLVVAAAAAALTLSPAFQVVLVGYLLLTVLYSVNLKHRPIVDVLVLASLYTIRLLGGSAAAGVRPSFWLLAFSVFLFLSLALVKRYAELTAIAGDSRANGRTRGYLVDDRALVAGFGQTSGLMAVLVLALYVNSPEISLLYRSPVLLWLILPPMLYWVCRIWLKASRGQMHDDPVVFAATDGPSLVAGAVMLAIAALATVTTL